MITGAEATTPGGGAEPLPAVISAGDGRPAVAARPQGPASMGHDLVRTITQAAQAVRYLDAAANPAADIHVTTVTAPVCTGDTPADALQAAADFARAAPHLQINAVSFARIPGHAENVWQYSVALYVTAADPHTGEFGDDVHHSGPVRRLRL